MIDKSFRTIEEKYNIKTFQLPKESEIRIRNEFDTNILIKLDQGFAEINGAEMTPYFWYRLPKIFSISIFTWAGCTLRIVHLKHKELQHYVYNWHPEEDNCNYFLANCYYLIDNARQLALETLQLGPKVGRP